MSFLSPVMEITQEDIQTAGEIFRYITEKANIEYKNGQWYDRTSGYAVPWWMVKSMLNEALDEARRISIELSSGIISGDVTKEKWAKKILELLKRLALLVIFLLENGELGEKKILLERFLQEQEAYLLNRVERMGAGFLSGIGMISKMYVNSVSAFFEFVHRENMKKVAMVERRVLGAAEHCVDCIRYAEMGWQPIGTLPPIGQQSACMVNCKCHFEYMLSDGTVVS